MQLKNLIVNMLDGIDTLIRHRFMEVLFKGAVFTSWPEVEVECSD